MNYSEQLSTEAWATKRDEIKERDCHKCQFCHNKNLILKHKKGIYNPNSGEQKKNYKVLDLTTGYEVLYKKVKNKFSKFKAPMFLIYQESNGYIEIKGHRLLTSDENKHYYLKKEEIKGIYNNSYIKSEIRFSPREIGKYIEKKVEEFQTPLEDCRWLSFNYLEVHHTYYTYGKSAWEYPNEALITLCNSCHYEIHKSQTFHLQDEQGNKICNLTPCKRCSGVGYLPQYLYMENGICYRCYNAKYEELI